MVGGRVMAFADKKGIVVASPFKLQAESMLDVRQQVDTLTERNELVTIKAATAGLRVYVKETKKSYVYNGTTWDELSIGNASLVVTLNGGTSEGTNKFTYNGTAAKTVNITAAGIGAAGKTHTHTKSEITDFPTSLKNPQALKFTGAATASYDGSTAVTVTIPTTSKTTKSLIVTLNGGTTEGTNKFTFDGSAEKTINITPSTIGAAAATHTHDKSQITGLTTGRVLISDANGHPAVSAVTSTELGYLDGVTSNIQTQLNGKAASNHTHNYAGSSSAGGSANSAVKLVTARKINGTSFDGTRDINVLNNYFASLTDEDLNAYRTYGEYYAGGGNTCANKPTGADAFYLKIFRNASGYTAQELYNGTWYSRYYNGTAWTPWSEQYSSTNKPSASDIGAAPTSHTHTKSQITDFPTSMKNPYSLTFSGAVTGTYDGSRAVTINIPTTGATTKSSLTIQLNGGTTEGTNKFTFNGGTAKTINITPASIGAAAASHGTHVTYGTTAPKANGTASAGTANSVSRSDHVHPLQTTVSGNAGSATKLQTKRNIDGVQFDGSANIVHFGSCSTAAGTAAKVVSCTGFVLASGSRITVKFTTTNTAANPTLNVNSTGAKAIKYRGSTISAGYLAAGRVYTFIYDGTNYELVGDINTDTNTTYNTGTASTAGLTKLYTTTGSAVDGTMTQKAITDALSGKASSSHTHGVASTTANGFLKQLDGSTSHFMRGDGVWATPPNTTYSAFKAATSSAAGGAGLVPAPAAGAQSKFLRGDATWQTISLYTFGVTATATELNYMDGVTSNVQTQLNGKAASSHTHNYAGSSSAGGAANSVKTSLTVRLNGGNTEGTNKFTFNGSAAKTINITPSSIGAAAASHGTHVTYGTSAPKANGTASAGSAASVSRSDHVHPLQTTVSGNAGSATKLQTKRNIDGVQFDGSASITHFGSCSTAAATAAKVVSCTGFVLGTGARITVKFTVTNTAANPTLNVNGTGAKAIKYRGSTISAGYLAANRVYTFIYDGTDYELVGDINTNTTYNTGTASTAGLTRLYTSTGSAVDGTMTQKAITDALAGKSSSSHTHKYAGSSSAGGAANSANKINGIALTNQSLNDYHNGVNFYYGAGGNTCTNKPSGIDNFGMFVFQSAGGWWTQILYGSDNNMYTRRYVSSSWTTWSKIYSTTNKPKASDIGAAAASHTHNYAGSSSAGGAANSVKSALTIQFNGSTKATFNGSAAATVNITPSAIGAAASSHTHNYAGSSSVGGAANSAKKVPVPVGTVLFATSSSTSFFNSCFGGTWEIVGNIDAIVGNGTSLTLYMFRKTAA